MTLALRLLRNSRGGGGFTPPHHTLGGPYDPSFDAATTILTQLHCHTNNAGSDGSSTPAAVVAFYASRGYQALAITDHNLKTSQPAGITTAIPGNELGVGTSMQHIIAIGSTYEDLSGETDAQTIIDNVRSAGGEAHIAHPNWIGTSLSAATMAALTDYYGIEVHNGKVLPGINADSPITYSGYAIDKWDDVLATKPDTWAVAVDDYHGNGSMELYDSGRVQVFAPSNSLVNIKASLVAGNFVADVANYGVTPGFPYRSPAGIYVNCPGAVRMEAWGSAGRLEVVTADEMAYTVEGSEGYVRLVAIGDYTEPFTSALPHPWLVSDGTWTVSGGVVALSGVGAGPGHLFLRRHRQGDFTAQVKVKLEDGGGNESAVILFNVLNEDYWYGIRIGESASGTFDDKLAILNTTDGGTTTPLIGSAAAYVAAMDVWHVIDIDYEQATGRIRAKVREDGDPDPGWMVDATDTDWTWGGFGFRANYTAEFDDLYVSGFQTFYQPVTVA